MAYTPNTWATGDTITAAKLNNMEQGIASASGGPLLVTVGPAQDEENMVLDKTWAEIHDAILSNGVTIIEREVGDGYESTTLLGLQIVNHDPKAGYLVEVGDTQYTTTTADGYPQTNWS